MQAHTALRRNDELAPMTGDTCCGQTRNRSDYLAPYSGQPFGPSEKRVPFSLRGLLVCFIGRRARPAGLGAKERAPGEGRPESRKVKALPGASRHHNKKKNRRRHEFLVKEIIRAQPCLRPARH